MPSHRINRKTPCAKFESLRHAAFYQLLSLENYAMLLKITWSGLNRNFFGLFFFYAGSLERGVFHIT